MITKAVLTDIEGTTSSLSFVKDVLFPYARKNLPEFVKTHSNEPGVLKILEEAKAELNAEADIQAIITAMLTWIDEDRKITALKNLQGLIWEKGYQNKDFFGHIYEDAWKKLKEWKNQGITLWVYSSGSVYAQKLLFGNTQYGDLNGLFSGNFDTNVGQKKEKASYLKIASIMQHKPEEIFFLSDITEELDAAGEAGMNTCLLVRDGKIESKHPRAVDFNGIIIP